jgi:small-conductance mechanosensitive channel
VVTPPAGVVAILQTTPTSTPQSATTINPTSVFNAVLVLVGSYLLARALSYTLTTVADRLADQRFRVTMVIPLLKFLIYGSALWIIIKLLFNLTTTQLAAFAGLLGAAIGLGLKDFLADIVGGLIVVLEQPYQVGDKVSVGDHYGEVVDIGIRSTTLVTPNDTAVVVPNFHFLNRSIANANTSDAEMLVVVEFYVAPDTDVDEAREVIEDAMVTSPYVYVDEAHPFTVVVEDELYYRTLRGKAYVSDLRDEHQFKSDVTERVLDEYAARGIESPKMAPREA